MEGGLEEPEPEEDPEPELEDPPVDVDPDVGGLVDPEVVGGLEEPEELVGGLEVVGGVGGGARRRTEVFTEPLKEAVAAVAAVARRAMSVRRKRILCSK